MDHIERVRQSIEAETGEPCERFVAEVWVDLECDAFWRYVEGVGKAEAVARFPDTAEHLGVTA